MSEIAESRAHEASENVAWKNVAAGTLPALACFLGGATAKWSEGVVVACLGILLLANPPRFSLGGMRNALLCAFAAVCAVSFLPAHFVATPEWRTALTNDFGIALPRTISPQPWLTLNAWLSVCAGLCWLYYVAAQPLELRATRTQLRVFAFAIALLAAVCLALKFAHLAPQFWHNERGFGPFPNRNQTGDLFGLTAIIVLACGQDDVRHGRIRWVFWLGALALLVAALVLNFSRAGLAILVLGSALWIGGFVFEKRTSGLRATALGLSALLVLLTALLFFGGGTLDRFHLRTGNAGFAGDFRWLVFRDAWQLIRASPWCGIGLGNFEPVFAIFRDASIGNSRALHPESDWLWLLTEAGWPAVALALTALIFFLVDVFPLREGTNQRFRRATLIAALLCAVHGLIDVSAHRVGTAYAAILLLGLALHRPFQFRASRVAPWIFRALGLTLLIIGAAWVLGSRKNWPLPGGIGVANAKHSATVANRERDFAGAIVATNRALVWAPLDWELYFLRAAAEMGAQQAAPGALDDFRRARFLEPNSYEVPLAEGKIWLPSDATLAITAWREALRRAGPQASGVYSYLLANTSSERADVQQSLGALASENPELLLIYLARLEKPEFADALRSFLQQHPDLHELSAAQKTRLFALWEERGARAPFIETLEAHAEWLPFAWASLAQAYAAQRDFQRAMTLAQHFEAVPVLPTISGSDAAAELQRRVNTQPRDYGAGFALYSAQMNEGKIDDALGTLRHFTAAPNAPAYFHSLEAELWARKGEWERAWSAHQKFQARPDNRR